MEMKESLVPSPHLNPLGAPPGRDPEADAKRPLKLGWRILWRIIDVLIGGLFIYAGIMKAFDPVGFARDIDNYKFLPWPVAVALGLYLPWLEILSGLALVTRRLYRGALLILAGLIIVFIAASIIAKARGLDISCGCFGHVSKGWSFGWHLALDFGILGGLIALWFVSSLNAKSQQTPSHRDGLQL
jgi:putative oxidoreductase